jgi:hypothetical protein
VTAMPPGNPASVGGCGLTQVATCLQCLFIYAVFNDAKNRSNYTAANDSKILNSEFKLMLTEAVVA